ncbi:hypothetical protein SAMN05216525_11822 [Bradyrhizobium sp. Gha]|nr:hypothetical protein SAMN05216525_11822 [Bradyrhizobium sp. Gha]
MPPHLTVYYNTRCPVCDAGIDWQRNKLLASPMRWHSLAHRSTTSGAACMQPTRPDGSSSARMWRLRCGG